MDIIQRHWAALADGSQVTSFDALEESIRVFVLDQPKRAILEEVLAETRQLATSVLIEGFSVLELSTHVTTMVFLGMWAPKEFLPVLLTRAHSTPTTVFAAEYLAARQPQARAHVEQLCEDLSHALSSSLQEAPNAEATALLVTNALLVDGFRPVVVKCLVPLLKPHMIISLLSVAPEIATRAPQIVSKILDDLLCLSGHFDSFIGLLYYVANGIEASAAPINSFVGAVWSKMFESVIATILGLAGPLIPLLEEAAKSLVLRTILPSEKLSSLLEWHGLILHWKHDGDSDPGMDVTLCEAVKRVVPVPSFTWRYLRQIAHDSQRWTPDELVVAMKNLVYYTAQDDNLGRETRQRMPISWVLEVMMQDDGSGSVFHLADTILSTCLPHSSPLKLHSFSQAAMEYYGVLSAHDAGLDVRAQASVISKMSRTKSYVLECIRLYPLLANHVVQCLVKLLCAPEHQRIHIQYPLRNLSAPRRSSTDAMDVDGPPSTTNAVNGYKKRAPKEETDTFVKMKKADDLSSNAPHFNTLLFGPRSDSLILELLSECVGTQHVSSVADCFLSIMHSPHPAPTSRQYTDAMKKAEKTSFPRDIQLELIVVKHPVILKILRIIAKEPPQLCRCSEILRSLLVLTWGNFNKMRKARAEKLSQNAWFPQVRDLLAVLEEGQWLAPGMQYVSDMIEHIQAKDAQDLIYSIWRLVRDLPPTPSSYQLRKDGAFERIWNPDFNEKPFVDVYELLLKKLVGFEFWRAILVRRARSGRLQGANNDTAEQHYTVAPSSTPTPPLRPVDAMDIVV